MTAAHAPAAERVLLDAEALGRTLARIAHEIVEGNTSSTSVALVGIYTRGVAAGTAPARRDRASRRHRVPLGALDIAFYRDDVGCAAARRRGTRSRSSRDRLDFPLDGRTVVLVDDVLYTGRTIRAAIEALFDYGRPARVQLAVLADRGHRELPIRPDYVGKNLPTRATSASRCSSSRWTRSTRSCSSRLRRRNRTEPTSRRCATTCRRRAARAAPPDLDRRPRPRRRRAHPRHRARLRGARSSAR